MQKLIDTSTAYYGGGNATTRKLFKVKSGQYGGRVVVIYPTTASILKFSYADSPYTSWSTPETIATNAADYPISGTIDDDGNVYLVYSKDTSLDLLFRKLTFGSGSWSVGSEVTVYNDKDNYFPSIVEDRSGKLTVAWRCYDSVGSDYAIRVKQSTDDGATWGSGPSDAGTALLASASDCYCQLVYLAPYIYCFYTDSGTKLAYRSIADGAVLWGSEVEIYSSTGMDDQFSVAASDESDEVAVAFRADAKLWFMEYDGNNWSGAFEIASSFATPPHLKFNGAIPYLFYGVSVGTDQIEVRYRYKNGSGFTAEASLTEEIARFTTVLLYDADGSPQYQTLTTEAGDSTSADVKHSSLNKLVEAAGDAIYLGSDEKFAVCRIVLATAGDAGGAVTWSYHDGSDWVAFTPASGAYNLDDSSKLVRLWQDSAAAPSGWQKNLVDGKSRYWIKVAVTSGYSTAPVGTQITPLVALNHING